MPDRISDIVATPVQGRCHNIQNLVVTTFMLKMKFNYSPHSLSAQSMPTLNLSSPFYREKVQ